jgi:glucokinase
MATAIGIDIGGTRIKAVRIDRAGQVLQQAERPTVEGQPELIATVRSLIDGFESADCCGVAAPGIAGPDGRCITWMRGRLDSVQDLVWAEVLGRPVWVINDAQSATLAEAWIGAARGRRHVVMLTLGTGVGGGVISEGRPITGATGRAGHLGHICLRVDGDPDLVRTPGSLEDLVGECTLWRRSGNRFATTAELLQAVSGGDAHARETWQATLRALACGLVSLINAFDPEAIVLGGGIANSGGALLDPLRILLDQLEWRPHGAGVPICLAALGDVAGAIGAAHWAMLREEQDVPD